MLHEVLLALSGHPSPLFNETRLPTGRLRLNEDFPLLTPSETALLQSIGRLAERHRQLRQQVAIIATTHPSIVCRAVATSIQQTHLGRFQQKILDVESKILSRESSTVGAYNIVPLASIVGEFDDWHRRMMLYYDIAEFMQPLPPLSKGKTGALCTGSALIDRLRNEAHTGFVDIEKIAVELSRVAETAWLRQLVSWLLYGKLPVSGAQDFFIQQGDGVDGEMAHFGKDASLLPSFVTKSTASSILFVGKSLYQIDDRTSQNSHPQRTNTRAIRAKLASTHLGYLSALTLPIVSPQFSQAVATIRQSLSKNVLQHLLPMKATMQVLNCLRGFFLLSRGEFAVALAEQAQKRLEMREVNMGRLLQQDPIRATRNLAIKDAELQQTLTATWRSLVRDHDDLVDDLIDYARSHVTLSSAVTRHDSRPSSSDSSYADMPSLAHVSFDDILFPTSSSLGLIILSPVDLFISSRDVQTYSTIFSYLFSIRRAKLQLSDLWRRSSIRRDRKNNSPARDSFDQDKSIQLDRRRKLRKVWATCSAALFLISETTNYFDMEVVKPYLDHFEAWVQTPGLSPSEAPLNAADDDEIAPKDPETLAAGHRVMLACLVYALLLTDINYTRDLRSLLGNLDAFVAFFTRLLTLHDRADAERAADGEAFAHTADEARTVALELDRARTKVDGDLKNVLARLRGLDLERIGPARHWDLGPRPASEYVPWRGIGGLERLLMKLEFGRMLESGMPLDGNYAIV